MAFMTIKRYSASLHRVTSFEMFIPNDLRTDVTPLNGYQQGPMRTLFLLHGYTGAPESWGVENLAAQYNVALVMPSGENSFWLDGEATGRKFAAYLGEELPAYLNQTFGLCRSREDTGICGLSMGGFGALHTGLSYPERFGQIGAMSSALIVHEIAHMKPGEDNGMANYAYYRECFGDLEHLEGSPNDPESLVHCQPAPKMFICCGTEDFLLENNRAFHRFLEKEGVPHVYQESPGSHDWKFWGEYTPKILEWMWK